MDAEVIVVGAGPAGAMCAYLLACAGVKVIILEKAILPRYKPCGGGLTPRALKFLPFDPTPVVEVRAVGGQLTWEGRLLLQHRREPYVALLVMRDQFDAWLIGQAQKAGARLWSGTRVLQVEESADSVQVETSSGVLRAAYLVGADGVNSVVARSLRWPRRPTGVALEAEVRVSAEGLEHQGAYLTFDFGAVPYGYGWIFPKAHHLSVGVFYAREGRVPDLRMLLAQFMSRYPHLVAGKLERVQGHHIPLGGAHQPLHTQRTLLVGDAANLADAFLGEGISYALWSAHLAAEALLGCLANPQASLATYTRAVQVTLGRELRYAARLARWVYAHPKPAATLLVGSAWLQTLWVDTLTAQRSFTGFLHALPFYLPAILAQGLVWKSHGGTRG
ncbi:geranylgeranyl reductase family protein [uncultured Thermanaerothrix sp.]|uniref:geranylgeranyl reductase family protein n=1 Tax=uncultured Thermanaerothrix sp. TaxID=1195149 RepID=UPI00261E51A2|nr:geranylgeranyl reductase family protein [uncultured Thermanaerothrix sp.]